MISSSDDLENDHLREWNEDLISQLECELTAIEKILVKNLQALEGSLSACPEEEVPREELSLDTPPLLCITNRIKLILQRWSRAEEKLLREQKNLKEQLKNQQVFVEDIEMERDVLLQQVHSYLQTNSSLRVRLEEQRCQTGALQRQLNANLEARINVLQNDKEMLKALNSEKDKQICKMYLVLEQTANYLKKKELEIMKLKNCKNNFLSSSKEDPQTALKAISKVEKKHASLKEQVDDYFMYKTFEELSLRRNSSLKKSLSVGDISHTPLGFIESTAASELPRCSFDDGLFIPPPRFKPHEHSTELRSKPLQSPDVFQALIHSPRSWPNAVTSLPQTDNDTSKKENKLECQELPVHAQLNALRRGLLNVTRKLEMLKCQLIKSGAIEKDPKPRENPLSLKRKATPLEELDGGIAEDPKSEFKNLKSFLEDAKSLNTKLQNLREETQKIIDINKKEAGVQVDTKKNDELCQTEEHSVPPFRHFETALTNLKKALINCEERISKYPKAVEEAFSFFVTALTECILENSLDFYEWKRRTDSWFGEIDMNSLMDKRSMYLTPQCANGGGDSLLNGLTCKELKIQIHRLKSKIIKAFQKDKMARAIGLCVHSPLLPR